MDIYTFRYRCSFRRTLMCKKKVRKKIQTAAQPLYVHSSVCIFVTESCENRLDISIEFLKFVKYDETLIVQGIILFLYVC